MKQFFKIYHSARKMYTNLITLNQPREIISRIIFIGSDHSSIVRWIKCDDRSAETIHCAHRVTFSGKMTSNCERRKVKRGKRCYRSVYLHVGDAVTLVGWGTQVHVLLEVADLVQVELGASCEVVDLVSILPWDTELVCKVISSF